jgi:uncharacterized protein (UPF0332 family)
MHDAARAALLATDASFEFETVRTHSGLISAFSLRLVKPGLVPVELGKAFNKAEELRLVADYKGIPSIKKMPHGLLNKHKGLCRRCRV